MLLAWQPFMDSKSLADAEILDKLQPVENPDVREVITVI